MFYEIVFVTGVFRKPYEAGMNAGTHLMCHPHTSTSGRLTQRGVVLVGDALSARHPITAAGVSSALKVRHTKS